MKNTRSPRPKNSYDETKKMLNRIREIQNNHLNESRQIREQEEPVDPEIGHHDYLQKSDQLKSFDDKSVRDPNGEGQDYAVINDVEVVIHSEDPEDLELSEEEKGNISQLIDDFRTEVAETTEFDKLHVYESSATLNGKISEISLEFTLSTGDDTGLYINSQMLKVDEKTNSVVDKLAKFSVKFSNTINNLLVRRKTT